VRVALPVDALADAGEEGVEADLAVLLVDRHLEAVGLADGGGDGGGEEGERGERSEEK
jgi:hypothetical protein